MRIKNKKVSFNYFLEEKFESGISLIGGEVKSIRDGKASLDGSFAKIINGEVYLLNAKIPIAGKKDYDPARLRKLLLHRKQISQILVKMRQKKLTLVPTSIYTKNRLIKVEIALAKSKRKFEKKETKKRKDIEREIAKELNSKY